MKREAGRPEEQAVYVSTPQGLFTASGVWFQARAEELRRFAEPVLVHVPLEALVQRAERWLQAPQTAALWTLPLLLWAVPPLWAALGALLIYAAAEVLVPAAATRWGAALVSVLSRPVVQGLFYVLVLSLLAAGGQTAAVIVGLAGFVLVRWGVAGRLVQLAVRPATRALYPLPVPDQVLRAFIIRAALTHGVDLPVLRRMEEEIAARWGRPPGRSG